MLPKHTKRNERAVATEHECLVLLNPSPANMRKSDNGAVRWVDKLKFPCFVDGEVGQDHLSRSFDPGESLWSRVHLWLRNMKRFFCFLFPFGHYRPSVKRSHYTVGSAHSACLRCNRKPSLVRTGQPSLFVRGIS